MYFWVIKKIARAYVDIISIGSVLHHEDMERLKKIRDHAKMAEEKAKENAHNN